MSQGMFTYRSHFPVTVERLFGWHEMPGAFGRLSPPWVKIDVLERTGGITDGSRVTLHISNGPIGVNWTLEHRDYIKNKQFSDFQIHGPLSSWEQVHLFEADGENAAFLEDAVKYDAGPLRDLGVSIVANHELERLFRYRHETLFEDLEFANAHTGKPPMKIAVTGATGFIGSALVPFLTTQGHTVRTLVRSRSKHKDGSLGEQFTWDPANGQLDEAALEGCDAIIHLAGDNIGHDRWDAQKKARMRSSRIDSTKLICQKIGQLKNPPRVFACASAIGFYGDRGDERLTENSTAGIDFLAQLCGDWESAAKEAEKFGTRVVNMRIGVVISPKGGAIQKMLLPFQMGAGGNIGSGRQWFSWIALDDVVGAMLHCLLTDSVSGPVNLVAPNAVTNAEFTRTFGHVIQRPTIFPMPAFAARMAFGEFAEACLLSSTHVIPEKLTRSDYRFRFPTLEDALRHTLGKHPVRSPSAV